MLPLVYAAVTPGRDTGGRRRPLMTDPSKAQKPKIEELELNRETLQELGEHEGEQAKGGMGTWVGSVICHTVVDAGVPGASCLYTKC
jgi:hypothetical protein